jgi:sulfopropanediol 3-dehydrogenase
VAPRQSRPSPCFRLSPEEIAKIISAVPATVLADIEAVQARVRRFARHQLDSLRDFEVETEPGVRLGQKNIPVGSVGAYVPGGRYPLVASAHMTVVTAKVAGVERVTACTPPIRGEVPAATVAAMHLAGADEILLLGGTQAVAAMALGTETVTKADLLAGPGNAYVAEAKRQLFGEVGIDLFAGPTETLIVADAHADPFVVAVDLLSQAEHGPDSPAVLITTSEALGRRVLELVGQLLPGMPTVDFAGPAWRDHGQVAVVDDLAEAYSVADRYASEHVQIRGAANHTGGLWVGKYLKTVTYQEVTDQAASAMLGALCGRAARVEQFEGHARSGDVRAWKYAGAPLPWALAAR